MSHGLPPNCQACGKPLIVPMRIGGQRFPFHQKCPTDKTKKRKRGGKWNNGHFFKKPIKPELRPYRIKND